MSSVGVSQSHDWLTKEMSKLLWLGEPVLSTGPPGWDTEQRRVTVLVLEGFVQVVGRMMSMCMHHTKKELWFAQ